MINEVVSTNKSMPPQIGDIFYIQKGEWESRGSDEKYHRYAIGGITEDEKGWLCYSETGHEGIINKRSLRFREVWSGTPETKTHAVFTQEQKDANEYAEKHRSEIVNAVKQCNPFTLMKIAKMVEYDDR